MTYMFYTASINDNPVAGFMAKSKDDAEAQAKKNFINFDKIELRPAHTQWLNSGD